MKTHAGCSSTRSVARFQERNPQTGLQQHSLAHLDAWSSWKPIFRLSFLPGLVCVCWVLCVGVGHTHTYTRAHSSGSSCYLCVFNRTKDASSHVQMLLYRPAFLSFQKPSLQEKCLDFPFLCLLFSFFYTVSNVVLLFYFIFSYLSSMNFHCSYLWELGHGVNDRNARLRFYFLGFIIVIIIIYFCKRKKTP